MLAHTSYHSPIDLPLEIEEKRNCDAFPFNVVGITCTVVGAFIVLAAMQKLPAGPNLISRMGKGGEILGASFMLGGAVSFLMGSVKNMCRSQQLLSQAKALNKALNEDTEPLDAAIVDKYMPKNKKGETIENTEYRLIDYQFNLVKLEAQPSGLVKKEAFSQAITSFVDLFENGQFTIPPIDSSHEGQIPPQIRRSQAKARIFNHSVNCYKLTLATALTAEYSDLGSPPSEFANSENSPALKDLKAAWETAVQAQLPKKQTS